VASKLDRLGTTSFPALTTKEPLLILHIASIILVATGAYLSIGVLFAIAFLTRGLTRVDHAAEGAHWTFRLVLFPGVTALWPLVARMWLRAARDHTPREENT
jgi:hypothetical protein